ncbi:MULTISPECIES: ribbon-helix-helix domain-containing protein [unclassified Mannheimia]|uniref:type II toxin-antitoxin system RelB family antitoxin n=1 Tax=unclassified Mannheimia TaxID=2645054 RepID=UPI00359CFD23
MAMTVRLDPRLDERLNNLTKQTGRSKSFYLAQALESYLENIEDLLLANAVTERIRAGKERTYTADEVRNAIKMERDIL